MENKKTVQNEDEKVKATVKQSGKTTEKDTLPEKSVEKKQKKQSKKSSDASASSTERSAVSAVNANSSKDVKGSSGLANTGPAVSYD